MAESTPTVNRWTPYPQGGRHRGITAEWGRYGTGPQTWTQPSPTVRLAEPVSASWPGGISPVDFQGGTTLYTFTCACFGMPVGMPRPTLA